GHPLVQIAPAQTGECGSLRDPHRPFGEEVAPFRGGGIIRVMECCGHREILSDSGGQPAGTMRYYPTSELVLVKVPLHREFNGSDPDRLRLRGGDPGPWLPLGFL